MSLSWNQRLPAHSARLPTPIHCWWSCVLSSMAPGCGGMAGVSSILLVWRGMVSKRGPGSQGPTLWIFTLFGISIGPIQTSLAGCLEAPVEREILSNSVPFPHYSRVSCFSLPCISCWFLVCLAVFIGTWPVLLPICLQTWKPSTHQLQQYKYPGSAVQSLTYCSVFLFGTTLWPTCNLFSSHLWFGFCLRSTTLWSTGLSVTPVCHPDTSPVQPCLPYFTRNPQIGLSQPTCLINKPTLTGKFCFWVSFLGPVLLHNLIKYTSFLHIF